MKILILGGSGMLGHQLYRHFRDRHEVKVTLRQPLAAYTKFALFHEQDVYDRFDIRDQDALIAMLADFKPDAIINAVGLIKHRPSKLDVVKNLEMNALFPHRLSLLAKAVGARVVHLSTDCVFNGKRGGYAEQDMSDAEDVYGKTKFLGELHDENAITLRTSIIGFELENKASLLEWVISQAGNHIKGFTQAIYTGFTTNEMARVIERVLLYYPNHSGLYQVASDVINKYDLLCMINQKFKLDLVVEPTPDFCCDRSLLGERFCSDFEYAPPSWDSMIGELAEIYQTKELEKHEVLG